MNYLTTRRPMRNLFGLHNEMGRIFGDLLGSDENGTDTENTPWMPTADISETDNAFEIRAELPGVAKDDLSVSVKDNFLTLSGEKRLENSEDKQNFRRVERRYGSFQRRFTLPPDVAVDDIKADYTDGVLTLSIPKPEVAKPTEVPITTAS